MILMLSSILMHGLIWCWFYTVTLSNIEQVGYTDNSGNDVRAFVYEKLQDPKLRTFLLSIEEDIRAFLADNKLQSKVCPPMTSYYRMVIHRVAAYFGLEHNVDASGKSVIITKVPNAKQ